MVPDTFELVSDLCVDISCDFIYLDGTPSLIGDTYGHFSRLKIVIARDASAVNPDEIATKPDMAAQFADEIAAMAIRVGALNRAGFAGGSNF